MRFLSASTTFDLRDARGMAIAVLGGGALLSLVPGHAGLPCPLRTLTGVPCPMCGGTTSVEDMFRGHPLGSLDASPLGVFAIVAAVLILIRPPRRTMRVPLSALCVMLLALWLFELHRFALI